MSDRLLKYLTITILTLALLVWLGAGYLYFDQNNSNFSIKLPSFNLPIFSTTILNWKTYQNDFLAFNIKYPSDLEYTTSAPNKPELWELITFSRKDTPDNILLTVQINQVSPQNHKVFNLASQATTDNPATLEEDSTSGGKRTIMIALVKVKDISWVKQTIRENNQTILVYMTTQKKDQRVYTITFTGPDKSLEEIIQTFIYAQT